MLPVRMSELSVCWQYFPAYLYGTCEISNLGSVAPRIVLGHSDFTAFHPLLIFHLQAERVQLWQIDMKGCARAPSLLFSPHL